MSLHQLVGALLCGNRNILATDCTMETLHLCHGIPHIQILSDHSKRIENCIQICSNWNVQKCAQSFVWRKNCGLFYRKLEDLNCFFGIKIFVSHSRDGKSNGAPVRSTLSFYKSNTHAWRQQHAHKGTFISKISQGSCFKSLAKHSFCSFSSGSDECKCVVFRVCWWYADYDVQSEKVLTDS